MNGTMLWEPGGGPPRELYKAEDMMALNALANVQTDIKYSLKAQVGCGLTMFRQADRGFSDRNEEIACIYYMRFLISRPRKPLIDVS